MALAPEQARHRHPPPLHHRGRPPLRRAHVGAARRADHELPGRHGRLRAARRRVPHHLVAQRHQHRRPEVLPRHPRHRRARVVAAPGDRPGRRHDHPVGPRGRLLRRRDRGRTYNAELKHLLVTQKAAFNSPVWFNIGVPGVPQQASACFILSVDDTDGLDPQLVRRGGHDLQGRLRLGHQPRRTSARRPSCSRAAAPPPARSASCAAPTPPPAPSSPAARPAAPPRWSSSTSTTPTSRSSSGCKAREEKKIRVLEEAGFDMSLDGKDMALGPVPERQQLRPGHRRVHAGRGRRRRLGPARPSSTARSSRRSRPATSCARSPQAAWECADPGMQFDTTINHWHTAPNTGRINGSNPCSEYMHLDNSACNLASLNLLKFLDDDDRPSTSRASSTPSRSCSPARRSWSAGPTTRPRPSARTPARSASSASATPTSAPC